MVIDGLLIVAQQGGELRYKGSKSAFVPEFIQ